MAKKYNFDLLIDRRSSDSGKWRTYPEDVLPLWVADMDFSSPDPVIRALRERVEQGVFGYPEGVLPDPKTLIPLREAIAEHQREHHGWQVQLEEIVFIPGVVTAFNLACHMVLVNKGGGGVLVQTPVYTPMLEAPGNAGLDRQEMELERRPDGFYGFEPVAFETALTGQTHLFLLCNPHNPVGRVFRKDELAVMAEACLRRGVMICSDEIHCDLVYPGQRHIPIASLGPEVAQNTITLISPSKTFNLPGLQCSAAIIQNPDLRKRFIQAGKGLVPWVNLMGLVAAQAAYREGQDWLDQLLVYLEGNRDYLFDYVQAQIPALKLGKPEGTYLAWLDCRESGIPGNPYKFFLEKARVALSAGQSFGRGGEGFVRLNFGCPRSILTDALERIKNALDFQN